MTDGPLNFATAAEQLKQWKLTGSNWGTEDAFLSVLSQAGNDGVVALTEGWYCRTDQFAKERIVRALADSDSPAAIASLRGIARSTGPGTEGSRWGSLYALARRIGDEATVDLEVALHDRSFSIRWCALIELAKVGSIDAWDSAYALLETMLKRPPPKSGTNPPINVVAVCYLGRFVDDAERRARLVGLVRRRWERFSAKDRRVIRILWPGVDPDGPEAEDLEPPEQEQLALGVETTSYTWGPLREPFDE